MSSEVPEERPDAYDANVTVAAEAQEVGIAGDDAVGSRRQHMVVVRVTTHRLDRGDLSDCRDGKMLNACDECFDFSSFVTVADPIAGL